MTAHVSSEALQAAKRAARFSVASEIRQRGFSLICAFVLAAAPQALANGGAFYTSVVQRTGNLVPMEKRLISLESEELSIRLKGEDAHVNVVYILENRGAEDTVTFGFPVDVATPETASTPNGYEWVMSNSIREFKVEDDGRRVEVERVIDKPMGGSDRAAGIDPKIQLVRRWSTLPLKFEAGKSKRLVVSYIVRCMARDEGFEGHTLWKYAQRTFFYTFKPAATWGDGRVRNLAVRLDTRELRQAGIAVTKIAPAGAKEQTEGVLTWDLQNKELSKLPDLSFWFDPTDLYRDRDVKRNLLDPEQVKSFSVSSTLPGEGRVSFAKDAMLDRDVRTAWVEGAKGPGIGEAITFEPKEAYITEIAMLNGYLVNERTYYANARIKKLRLDIEFKPEEQSDEPDRKPERHEITLPDRAYKSFKPRYPFSSVDWVLQHPHGDGFIKKVVLTILEVYPGREFEDTAMTEFYICGFK